MTGGRRMLTREDIRFYKLALDRGYIGADQVNRLLRAKQALEDPSIPLAQLFVSAGVLSPEKQQELLLALPALSQVEGPALSESRSGSGRVEGSKVEGQELERPASAEAPDETRRIRGARPPRADSRGTDLPAPPPSDKVGRPAEALSASRSGSGRVEGAKATPARAQPGRLFGRYQVLEEIGRGAMGVVYKVLDPEFPRLLALKRLSGGSLATAEELGRFRREAEIIAKLRHPNFVAVHDVGVLDGQPYFVMDFIEGTSLERMASSGVPARRALELIRDLAQAMHYAHRQGIVHRDLKPSNIVITPEGQPVVMDFGLAKALHGASRITQSGTALGTPSYMSPEQAGGQSRRVDVRSDVYSLGAILYELLTGKRAFEDSSVLRVLRQIENQPPVPPRRLVPSLHRDIETICLKAMEKNPDRRYESAAALAEDIDRYLKGDSIKARPPGPLELSARAIRRHPTLSAVAILCLAGMLSLAALRRHEARLRHAADQRLEADLALSGAASLMERGQYARALERLKDVPGLSPDVTAASTARAKAYLGLGMPNQALEELSRLSPLLSEAFAKESRADSPANEALLLRAEALSETGATQQAWDAVEQFLREVPRHPDGHLVKARLLGNRGEFDKALAEIDHVRSQSGLAARSRARAELERGAVLEKTGHSEEALQAYAESSLLDPRFAECYLRKANLWILLGKPDRAIGALSQCLNAVPEHYSALVLRARLHAEQDRLTDAIDDLGVAIRVSPGELALYFELAELQQLRGEPSRALASLDRALAVAPALQAGEPARQVGEPARQVGEPARQVGEPGQADVLLRRGRIFLQAGDLQAALDDFQSILSRDRDNAGAWHGKALGRWRQVRQTGEPVLQTGKPASLEPQGASREDALECLQMLELALSGNPDFAEAHADRARILWHLGRHEEALQAARRSRESAMRWPPETAELYLKAAPCLSFSPSDEPHTEPYLQAVHVFQRLALRNPRWSAPRLGQMKILLGRGDFGRAHAMLLSAHEADPLDPEVLLWRARMEMNVLPLAEQRIAAAEKWLREAIDREPAFHDETRLRRVDAQLELAELLSRREETSARQVLELVDTASQGRPFEAKALVLRARALGKLGQDKEAREALAQLPKADRDSSLASLYYLMGRSLIKDDRYAHATRLLDAALLEDPRLGEAYQLRAESHLRLRKFGLCLADYGQVLLVRPELAMRFLVNAYDPALLFSVNRAQVLRMVDSEIDRTTDSAGLVLLKAFFLLETGDSRGAQSVLSQAERESPDHPILQAFLALADQKEKKFRRALKRYAQTLDKHPKLALLYYLLATCHAEMNDSAHALGALRRAWELGLSEFPGLVDRSASLRALRRDPRFAQWYKE